MGGAIVGAGIGALAGMYVAHKQKQFASAEDQAAAWKKFGADPDWQSLRARPEYADKKILCGITNLPLKPAPYSQI